MKTGHVLGKQDSWPPPALHLRYPVYVHEWLLSPTFLLWCCQTVIFFQTLK